VSLDRDWWPECGNVAESHEQHSEKVGQFAALARPQTSNAGGLGVEKRHECVLGQIDSGRREANENAPAVVRVGGTTDQSGGLEAMKPNRHAPGSQEEGLGELSGREPTVEVSAIQVGENVEIALVTQAVRCCDVVESLLEKTRRPEDTRHDREAGRVEVRSSLLPLPEHVVDTIAHVCLLSTATEDYSLSN
jgi:hypothetical protein